MSRRESSEESMEAATVEDVTGPEFAVIDDNGLLESGEEVGEYIVDAPIGKGGMGVVYRATHKVIGKSAAVKVLHRAAGERQAKRLIAEAQAVNRICHDNIVDVFDFGVLHDGRPYVVMELLVGQALDTRLAPDQPMSVVEALQIVGPIASALQAAHSQGIVHRDLKPANIFLLDNGDNGPAVKLLDFGIAKFLDADSNQGLTTDGMVLGTLAYMAPETASGKEVTANADTYSLGVMLYQMLVGALPFVGGNSLETLYAHVHTAPVTPTEKHIKLPRTLELMLLRMLSKKPGDRPSLSEVSKYASSYAEKGEYEQYLTPVALSLSDMRSSKAKRYGFIALGVAVLGAVVLLLLSLQSSSGATEAADTPAPEVERPSEPTAGADLGQEPAAEEAGASESATAGTAEAAKDKSAEAATPAEAATATASQSASKSAKTKSKERRRAHKRRKRKKRKKKGPADDAPIDPLRGMR